MTTFLFIVITTILLLAIVVATLSLRKRLTDHLRLIGKLGRVETTLTPEGTVIVCGELWPARSRDGLAIVAQSRIRVVSVNDLSLLVEACD